MDKDWLKYWQKVENLEMEEEVVEEAKNILVEEAKDLYKSVLNDEN